jgi:hypothetical protein
MSRVVRDHRFHLLAAPAAGAGVNRAGHSVEVLLRVFAKRIDGGEEASNRRIDEALTA